MLIKTDALEIDLSFGSYFVRIGRRAWFLHRDSSGWQLVTDQIRHPSFG